MNNSLSPIIREQDEPIGDVPLVFGAEIKTALTQCTGLPYEMITKRHVADLTQGQIQDLQISDRLRRKLASLRDYTVSLKRECDLLTSIRREFICPISYNIVTEPVIAPCCGKIFDKNEARRSLEHQKPDPGGHRYIMHCPLCRQTAAWAKWNGSVPSLGSIRDIVVWLQQANGVGNE